MDREGFKTCESSKNKKIVSVKVCNFYISNGICVMTRFGCKKKRGKRLKELS